MQAHYPAAFDRDMACTEAEWLMWLPGATQGHALTLQPGQAQVLLPGGGGLELRWHTLPPRQIALLRLPRLGVQFRFDTGVADDQRQRFMRYFDLYTQRGGG